ncbi:MAG: iron-sulfur cluster assembly accessory protein [Sphingomonadales bacterium]|nr:iron-sulfur cluster assembly accessory protein [Sphingomonadales bacterium]
MNTSNGSEFEDKSENGRPAESTPAFPTIRISPRAQQELERLSAHYQDGQITRLGVKGGGCSGLSYILEAGNRKEDDYIVKFESVTLAIEPVHALYLDGLHLDIGEGLSNRGFIFENPNAGTTCGCGTSFSL